jgi:hypothetical protein
VQRTTRTRLLVIAVNLALGCALSVAVAWACWVWSPSHVNARLGTYLVRAGQTYVYFVDERTGAGERDSAWVDSVPAERLRVNNGWLPFGELPSEAVVASPGQSEVQCWCGWPFTALRGEETLTTTTGAPVAGRGMLELPRLGGGGRVRIPSRPSIGLAANAILFAGAVAFCQRAVVGLFRAARRWRGRCASCNYDLRGLPGGLDARCPECGAKLP